jgi:Protein of unknown function (DUF2905)
MSDFGKLLIGLGVLMILLGGVLFLTGKVPWLGRLPGDIKVERENWSFYFPLGTSLLLSAVLSLILWLFSRR